MRPRFNSTADRRRHRARHRPVWAFRAAVFLISTLAAGPTVSSAGKTSFSRHPTVLSFLERTVAPRENLDELAREMNPLQIPLLANAIAEAERTGAAAGDLEYRAFVRWHYWLGSKLDPMNRGFWSHQPDWTGDARRSANRVSPGLAALELMQLRALASLAHRRGYAFDAMVWWREHSSLLQRLGTELYDPAVRAYVALDSTGHRAAEKPGLGSWLPLAFGAPVVAGATESTIRTQLAGDLETPLDDLTAKLRAMQALDPMNGWPDRPGDRLLDVQTTVELLHVAVARLREDPLTKVLEEALAGLDLAPRGGLTLRLGPHQIPIPVPDPELPPLARSRGAVEFLERIELVEPTEAARVRQAIESATLEPGATTADVPDSVTTILARALGQWRQLDLQEMRARVRPDDLPPQPPNGEGEAAAFRLLPSDERHWIDEALRRITEDVLALHLKFRPQAHFTARVEPHALPRGTAPVLRVRARGDLAPDANEDASWTGAWSTGRMVDAPFPIEFTADGDRGLRATLPPPPGELGLWWLILSGPAGGPVSAAGVGLVEPFIASVETESVELNGTSRFVVRVENRVASDLQGRFDLTHPVDWRLDPVTDGGFFLGPGETRTWRLALIPTADVGPGTYPIEWRFHGGISNGQRISGEVAVPFQWLRVGPFEVDGDEPLAPRFPPEGPIDLTASYEADGRSVTWERLPLSALRENGWIAPTTPRESTHAPGSADPEQGRKNAASASVWYLLTAFSTVSQDVAVTLESPQPALLRLNGRQVVRCEGFRHRASAETRLAPSTNYVLLKLATGANPPAQVRLALKDADGGPLRGVNSDLKQLLEQVSGLATEVDSATANLKIERRAMRQVSFSYFDTHAQSVAIVGTFNGWSPTASPMVKLGNGRWQGEVRLRPGRFEYKFAVDGETWVADPENPVTASDGFGGHNSVLEVE